MPLRHMLRPGNRRWRLGRRTGLLHRLLAKKFLHLSLQRLLAVVILVVPAAVAAGPSAAAAHAAVASCVAACLRSGTPPAKPDTLLVITERLP